MRLFLFISILTYSITASYGQTTKTGEIIPITRWVDGEVITSRNDTLIGKIKVDNYEPKYITSFSFKGENMKKTFTAYDVAWFRQVVPYPDREKFGVNQVYFKSTKHPEDDRKKAFLPTDK